MISKLRCLIKGHRYLMTYQPFFRCYHPSMTDKCSCCKRRRGKKSA